MPISALVSALTLVFCLTATTDLPQEKPTTPPRDNAPVAAVGTGIIRGRVTDRETGQPLARVMVTLMSSAWRDQALSSAAAVDQTVVADDSSTSRSEPRRTTTAVDGRYEFRKIPPGAYLVSFDASMTRGTHLDQSFGESAPRGPFKRGKRVPPIDLRDGETRENVDVALWRALALEGRVVDEAGEPVANANVIISAWGTPSSMSVARPRDTDDRGMFRLFGLRPGRYRICANIEQRFGPSDEETTDKFIRTCYPNADNDSEAQSIVLSSGDPGQIEIRLQRNRTYRITGIVIDSSGAARLNANVNLVAVTPTGGSSSSIQVKPDGQFIASGVTPGTYAIHAGIGNWHFNDPADKTDREIGYTPVRVDSTNVDGVVVATSKAAKVAGRIIFEGGLPEQATPKLSIMATPGELSGGGYMMFGSPNPVPVREDMSFELDDLFGPVFLMLTGAPRGWIAKSVQYRGEDVTDKAVEFKSSSDPKLLEVILTNQGATVSGRVMDDDNKVSSDASVVLLPGDLSRWRPFPGSPLFPTKADGTFVIGPVRAGEYIVAAVTGVSTPKLLEPSARTEFAEQIVKFGDRIILVENEKRSIDLRVVKLQ